MTYDAVLQEALKLPPSDRRRLVAAINAPSLGNHPTGPDPATPAGVPDVDDRDGTSVWDVLHESGLLPTPGEASDLPHDLSTNPKHMEGFGLSRNDPNHPQGDAA